MVYIVRGLPNSGKSTYSKKLGIFHLEADMYFMRNGKYEWSKDSLSSAHSWCLDQFVSAIKNGIDVVVSNTFVKLWEMKPYLDCAKNNNIEVKVIRLETSYNSNIHEVPKETVQRMARAFENFTEEEVIR